MKGYARGLVLTQRQKAIHKCPNIILGLLTVQVFCTHYTMEAGFVCLSYIRIYFTILLFSNQLK